MEGSRYWWGIRTPDRLVLLGAEFPDDLIRLPLSISGLRQGESIHSQLAILRDESFAFSQVLSVHSEWEKATDPSGSTWCVRLI